MTTKCANCGDDALPVRTRSLRMCVECRRLRRNAQNRESRARAVLGAQSARFTSPVVRQAILRQYVAERMSAEAVADLHDLHPNTVIRIVRRMGGRVRPTGRPSRGASIRPQRPEVHGGTDLTGAGS